MKKTAQAQKKKSAAQNTKKVAEAVAIAPVRTAVLKFTQGELVHLRDLFGILLPSAASQPLSQALAVRAGRQVLEARLWRKLAKACESMNIPMGDDAPDFTVAVDSVPSIGIFQVDADEQDDSESTGEGGSVLDVSGAESGHRDGN